MAMGQGDVKGAAVDSHGRSYNRETRMLDCFVLDLVCVMVVSKVVLVHNLAA